MVTAVTVTFAGRKPAARTGTRTEPPEQHLIGGIRQAESQLKVGQDGQQERRFMSQCILTLTCYKKNRYHC